MTCEECIKPEVNMLKKLVFLIFTIGAGLIYLLFDGAQVVASYQQNVNEFRQEMVVHIAEDKLRFSNMQEAQLELKNSLADMTKAYYQQKDAFNELSSRMDILIEKESTEKKMKRLGRNRDKDT